MIKNTCIYVGLRVKHSLIVSDFKETWIFLKRFSKKIKYQIS
jgi:hypothetical protein